MKFARSAGFQTGFACELKARGPFFVGSERKAGLETGAPRWGGGNAALLRRAFNISGLLLQLFPLSPSCNLAGCRLPIK
jgi:hypothetical protein